MPKLHFVQELTVGSSKRDQELERAKARSHAASVSHQNRRPPRPQPPLIPEGSRPHLAFPAPYGLHTAPEGRDLRANALFQPLSLHRVANLAPGRVLTPPGSAWSENLGDICDADTEHVGDITFDPNYAPFGPSSSSISSALIPQTRHGHNVYPINPHAQYTTTASHMPWFTATNNTKNFNLNFIPHDLHGTRADPFDCIPHREAHSSSINALRDYHAQIMAPNQAPIYKIFNVTNVYTSYSFKWLTHPDFLYAGVATWQAIIDHLRRKPDEPVGPSERVLKHIGTAMVRLRRRLGRVQIEMREREREKQKESALVGERGEIVEDNQDTDSTQTSPESAKAPSSTSETLVVDDMTIMTVLFLAVVTRAINDLPSHEIHKKTIASLVTARGGLQNLNGHDSLARCTLMQLECFWALNTGYSIFPEFRPVYAPEYPPVPLEPSSTLGLKVASLPVGFQDLAQQGQLALDVLEVLSRAASAHIEQALHGTIVKPSDVFRTKPRKFQDFWEACVCLGAPDEVYTDTDRTLVMMPNLEKMIVLALLLYSLHTFSPMGTVTSVYSGSRLKLTTDVPRRIKHPASVANANATTTIDVAKITENEEDVLLWIYFNLADSWRAVNDTLLPQCLRIMRDLRMRFPERTACWEICESVLKRFFWNEMFIKRCKMFWEVSEIEREGMGMDRDNG